MRVTTRLFPHTLLGLLLTFPAMAATVWDERIDGDLSNDPRSPSLVSLGLGSNVIGGSMVSPSDTRDFVTFAIGPGQQLSQLLLLEYLDGNNGGPGNRGFHAVNTGATSRIPGAGTAADFLGGDHLDPAPPGTDLLPILAQARLAGTGFSVPLGVGDYSYVIQQTGPQLTGYSLDFVVTAVPLPAAAWLFGSALLGLTVLARRRLRNPSV